MRYKIDKEIVYEDLDPIHLLNDAGTYMHSTEKVLDELVKPSAEIASQGEPGEPETCLVANDGQRQFCLSARKRVRCSPGVSVSPMLSPCCILELVTCHSLAITLWTAVSDGYSGFGCHCREFTDFLQPASSVQTQEGCWFHAYNSALRELETLTLWVGSHLWNFCSL